MARNGLKGLVTSQERGRTVINMSSNNTKLTARERARNARLAQAKREADATAAVETFFKATDSLDEMQAAYDKELEALEKKFAGRRKPQEAKAAKAVALLNESGDNKPSIAAQLGITVPEVTSWIERAASLPESEPVERPQKSPAKKGDAEGGPSETAGADVGADGLAASSDDVAREELEQDERASA